MFSGGKEANYFAQVCLDFKWNLEISLIVNDVRCTESLNDDENSVIGLEGCLFNLFMLKTYKTKNQLLNFWTISEKESTEFYLTILESNGRFFKQI